MNRKMKNESFAMISLLLAGAGEIGLSWRLVRGNEIFGAMFLLSVGMILIMCAGISFRALYMLAIKEEVEHER